jgi:hypothetical protein
MCPKRKGRIGIESLAKTGIYHETSIAPSPHRLKTWDLASKTAFLERPKELNPGAESEWGSSRAGDECYDSLVSGLCSACDLVAPSVDELCQSVWVDQARRISKNHFRLSSNLNTPNV